MVEIFSQRSRFWHFNAHAILSGKEAAVIDPGIFPEEIANFKKSIEDRGFQITTVILTHSHHDHIRGWQYFPGAKILSHQKVKAKDEAARARIVAAKEAIDRKHSVNDPNFRYPEVTLSFEDRFQGKIGDTQIEMRYLPGHSDCISVVIVPEAKAIFSGDYLVSPGMPYCRWRIDRFREAMLQFKNWVEEFQLESVYPAHNDAIHGHAKILEAIEREEDYFLRLIPIVQELKQSGKTEEEIAREAARKIRPEKLWEQDRDNAKRVLREL